MSLCVVWTGCMGVYLESIGEQANDQVERTFVAEFEEVWGAVLDALKNKTFDILNKESGFLQTKWILNTGEKNKSDSIEAGFPYVKAQYRFQVSLLKKKDQGILVTLRRQQLIMRDILDGWKKKSSDLIEEQTLLYRIGRLIFLKKKVLELDQKSAEHQLE